MARFGFSHQAAILYTVARVLANRVGWRFCEKKNNKLQKIDISSFFRIRLCFLHEECRQTRSTLGRRVHIVQTMAQDPM